MRFISHFNYDLMELGWRGKNMDEYKCDGHTNTYTCKNSIYGFIPATEWMKIHILSSTDMYTCTRAAYKHMQNPFESATDTKKVILIKVDGRMIKSPALFASLCLYGPLRISILLFISSKEFLSLSCSLPKNKGTQLRDLHNNSLLFFHGIHSQ